MKIVVTGGAGYIGSQTVFDLTDAGHEVAVIDRKQPHPMVRLPVSVRFHQADLLDAGALKQILTDEQPEAIVHFAALIEAGESVNEPAKYLENNVGGTANLLQAMNELEIPTLIFSSTAAVYGQGGERLLAEGLPLNPINPYGESKKQAEALIESACQQHGLKATRLRYFNAAGADAQQRTGECHQPETHLIPLVLEAAAGIRGSITIFGDNYPTPDGTCIRDYVHVADIAEAHRLALDYLANQPSGYTEALNIGTGQGYSVKEIIAAAEKVTGKTIPTVTAPRRDGDPDRLIAEVALAKTRLNFAPKQSDLITILSTAWAWTQKLN